VSSRDESVSTPPPFHRFSKRIAAGEDNGARRGVEEERERRDRGVFHLIVDATDKNNTNLNRRMMGKFRKLLAEVELKELYLNRRRYTWSNEQERATLERLDRVFSTVDWEVAFPSSFLSALSSSTSNHCPYCSTLPCNLTQGRDSAWSPSG
jgi:hypothetical protein